MSNASDIPSVAIDEKSPSFGSPDEAADAVSKDFGKVQSREQAAVIVQKPDGSYGYSTVAPQIEHDNFKLRAILPEGHKLAGVVHSHPGNDDNGQLFSPHDLDVADQLKVPSYIRFLKDDSIRKYNSGTTKTSFIGQAGTRMKIRTAKGDPLAQAAPAAAQAEAATPPPPPSGGLLSAAVQAAP